MYRGSREFASTEWCLRSPSAIGVREHDDVRRRRRDSRNRAAVAERSISHQARATTPRLEWFALVAAEMAIGLALSVLAALMIRSLVNLRAVDLGFQAESTVAARVSLPSAKYESVEQRRAFFDALLTGVRDSRCGVGEPRDDAAIRVLRAGDSRQRRIESGTSVAAVPSTDIRFVDDAYFSTLRIAVAAGSVFGPSESPVGPPRAVVSRSLARALWPDENAVGRRVSIKLFGNTVAEVIGVVDDVHLADARTPSRPAVFLSTDRYPSTERDIIVRGGGDANVLLGALRQSLAAVDATVPLYRATSLDRAVATTMAQDRLTTALLAAFAVLALLLAAVGVYGVLSGDVTRRRKEIGIRLALGANAGAVTTMVFRRALAPAVVGVAIGIVLALVLARSMSALVFGIGAYDAVTFVAVTVTLLVVATSASIVPAVRATRVSPLEAIRTD